jgi:hypothetical protein
MRKSLTRSFRLRDAKPGAVPERTARGLELFKKEFMQLFGWQVDGVDYDAPVDFAPALGEDQGVVHLIAE